MSEETSLRRGENFRRGSDQSARSQSTANHHFPAGRLFAFDNGRPHGAINVGPPRIHLVFDVPGGAAIDALLAGGTHIEGELDERALARLSEDPLADLTPAERSSPALMHRFMHP